MIAASRILYFIRNEDQKYWSLLMAYAKFGLTSQKIVLQFSLSINDTYFFRIGLHKQHTKYLGTFVFNVGFMFHKTTLKEKWDRALFNLYYWYWKLPIQELP